MRAYIGMESSGGKVSITPNDDGRFSIKIEKSADKDPSFTLNTNEGKPIKVSGTGELKSLGENQWQLGDNADFKFGEGGKLARLNTNSADSDATPTIIDFNPDGSIKSIEGGQIFGDLLDNKVRLGSKETPVDHVLISNFADFAKKFESDKSFINVAGGEGSYLLYDSKNDKGDASLEFSDAKFQISRNDGSSIRSWDDKSASMDIEFAENMIKARSGSPNWEYKGPNDKSFIMRPVDSGVEIQSRQSAFLKEKLGNDEIRTDRPDDVKKQPETFALLKEIETVAKGDDANAKKV